MVNSTIQIEADPTTRAAIQHLKGLDFELAYLALLTREGLKPISRWEKTLDEPALEALREIGLLTRPVRRRVRTGLAFTETIFGKSPAYLEVYAQHFENLPVDKSAETIRVEGFLFGYPPCCVAQYIKHPYAPNEFPGHKQEILFHWTCEGCILTPLLMPLYERIHQLTQQY
ncbi:MAG: hypothetical protein JSW27_13705 [Phycisphaerales bacterium]|nr:MAG: hypothetical protein JSW27_13705 [Phycisphaerales bacterium]